MRTIEDERFSYPATGGSAAGSTLHRELQELPRDDRGRADGGLSPAMIESQMMPFYKVRRVQV
jgi:hypothetical protein